MNPTLSELYDEITQGQKPKPTIPSIPTTRFNGQHSPRYHSYKHQLVKNRDNLKEKCYKHMLLDIYVKIHPIDDDYCADNMGMMSNDIDKFLNSKNMTAGEYFKSAYEETKAPLLEFVQRSIDNICNVYFEDAVKKLDENEKDGIDVPPEPDVDTEEVDGQLIDVEKDIEYEEFIDKLKKKTINKIVSDISKLISDKKDEKEMEFEPTTESNEPTQFAVTMDYLIEKYSRDGVDIPDDKTELIGLALRESVLNTIDLVFNQKGSKLADYRSKLRYNQGVLINESAIQELFLAAKK